MAKLNKTVIAALQNIQATGTVTPEVGKPLVQQGLIEVNAEDVAAALSVARARLTQKALDALPKPASADAPVGSAFGIITNAAPPPSKRGSGLRSHGAPKKYPFDALELNQSFFVSVSEDTPDPLKSLGSAISAANMRYAEDTGEKKQAKRAAKGPDGKARKDAAGKIVKELTEVPVYKFNRKFQIRGVVKDTMYGDWKAPADGALITRVAVPA